MPVVKWHSRIRSTSGDLAIRDGRGWTMEDGHLTEIKLYPISLGMTEKRPQKGVPVLTGDENVLSYLAELSKPYGTEMEIKRRRRNDQTLKKIEGERIWKRERVKNPERN